MWAASDASQRSPAPFPLPEPRRRRECGVGSGCCFFCFLDYFSLIGWPHLRDFATDSHGDGRRVRRTPVFPPCVRVPCVRSSLLDPALLSSSKLVTKHALLFRCFFFLFCFKTYGFHPLFFFFLKQHKRHMRNTHSMLVLLNM